ncbi:MAG TPA: tetratricopeptide repeat protein [Terriglobales bacterium]|nr:tetratricopeptide repeat protein [Terriglobales bacterium]
MKYFHWIVLLLCSPALLFAQLAVVTPRGADAQTANDQGSSSSASKPSSDQSDNKAYHSYSDDPRYTVSVSSLSAPDKARKAFEKAEEEVRKGRWQAATTYFRKAVETYPKYAIAWLELGRVQARQSSYAEAQNCFRQAVAQDSKLLDGYVELAKVATRQENWTDLADASDHLIQLAPGSSPEYWYMNSMAYYNLGKLNQAEASATHGLDLDPRHQVPEMEYVYGLILGTKKDYKGAAEHMSAYLRLAPDAQDKDIAKNLLAGYVYREQLAAEDQQ